MAPDLMAARVPLNIDRWTPYESPLIVFKGWDLTGAIFRAQIRLKPDTPGAPLVDLQTVTTASAEGVRLVSVEDHDGVPWSTVRIRINETTNEALPDAAEIGEVRELHWDMHITPSGGLKRRRLFGPVYVRPGDTQ